MFGRRAEPESWFADDSDGSETPQLRWRSGDVSLLSGCVRLVFPGVYE